VDNYSGGSLLLRYDRALSSTSDMTFQAYYDRSRYNLDLDTASGRDGFMDLMVQTFDVEFNHRFQWGDKQEIIWGLGYRFITDDVHSDQKKLMRGDPLQRQYDLVSAFIQDEIEIREDELYVILGSKFEHNDYTGLEVQPNARVLWKPNEKHSVWAAVSRAVRTPARFDTDVDALSQYLDLLPGAGVPVRVEVSGDEDFRSEQLLAAELGYRVQVSDGFSLDAALFYNTYDSLNSYEQGQVSLDPDNGDIVVTINQDNKYKGWSHGFELSAEWQATPWWRLEAAYSYLEMDLEPMDTSTDTMSEAGERQNPQNQLSVRSMMDLPHDLSLDAWVRMVDELSSVDVPAYAELDLRLAWRPVDDLELALIGRNLLHASHKEFDERMIPGYTEIERSVFAKLTWRY
jgi:iron complex outermembrane receptor protein